MKLDIDYDIRKAKTIPSKFYHSPKVYRNFKKIFNRSWQFVGGTDLLQKNNTHPGILLEGMVDEPYVLTKDGGKFSCMSNVCTCLLYTSPSPRDRQKSRMPSSA